MVKVCKARVWLGQRYELHITISCRGHIIRKSPRWAKILVQSICTWGNNNKCAVCRLDFDKEIFVLFEVRRSYKCFTFKTRSAAKGRLKEVLKRSEWRERDLDLEKKGIDKNAKQQKTWKRNSRKKDFGWKKFNYPPPLLSLSLSLSLTLSLSHSHSHSLFLGNARILGYKTFTLFFAWTTTYLPRLTRHLSLSLQYTHFPTFPSLSFDDAHNKRKPNSSRFNDTRTA